MGDLIGGGPGCWACGLTYGEHAADCPEREASRRPILFRCRTINGQHPNGSEAPYVYGCYFPMTDLCVGDMGSRGTGKPKDVEWL